MKLLSGIAGISCSFFNTLPTINSTLSTKTLIDLRVLVDDIHYVTRLNRKTIVATQQGEYQTAQRFEEWCNMLPPLFFYSVHNSFLVNLHYVKKYSYTELILTDGTRVPIASRKQSAFHRFWFEYLRRQ